MAGVPDQLQICVLWDLRHPQGVKIEQTLMAAWLKKPLLCTCGCAPEEESQLARYLFSQLPCN